MKLYLYPLSIYSQKVLMACYEKGLEVTKIIVDIFDSANYSSYTKLTPWGLVPMLVDEDATKVLESSIIIEYLDLRYPTSQRLIPENQPVALGVRYCDRVLDRYLTDPISQLVYESLKPKEESNVTLIKESHQQLDETLAWLDNTLGDRQWVTGENFSMADCAAAPALYRASKVHSFSGYANIERYWNDLSERASYQRVSTEATTYIAELKKQKASGS